MPHTALAGQAGGGGGGGRSALREPPGRGRAQAQMPRLALVDGVDLARLLAFGQLSEIALIILPSAMPTIISGLELAFAIAWIGTIGAEYLIGTGYMYASAEGIGAFLAGARENARMDLVVVGILSLAVAGFILDRLIVLASTRVLAWRPQSR